MSIFKSNEFLWLVIGAIVAGVANFLFGVLQDILSEKREARRTEEIIASKFPKIQRDLVRIVIHGLLRKESLISIPEDIKKQIKVLIKAIEKGKIRKTTEALEKIQFWVVAESPERKIDIDFKTVVRLSLIAASSIDAQSTIRSIMDQIFGKEKKHEAYSLFQRSLMIDSNRIREKNNSFQDCLNLIDSEMDELLVEIGTQLESKPEIIDELFFLENLKLVTIHERFTFNAKIFENKLPTELLENKDIIYSQIDDFFGVRPVLVSIRQNICCRGKQAELEKYFIVLNDLMSKVNVIFLWCVAHLASSSNSNNLEEDHDRGVKLCRIAQKLDLKDLDVYQMAEIEFNAKFAKRAVDNSDFEAFVIYMDEVERVIQKNVDSELFAPVYLDVFSLYHSSEKIVTTNHECEQILLKALHYLMKFRASLMKNESLKDIYDRSFSMYNLRAGRIKFSLYRIRRQKNLLSEVFEHYYELIVLYKSKNKNDLKEISWCQVFLDFATIFLFESDEIKAIYHFSKAYEIDKVETLKYLEERNMDFLKEAISKSNDGM